MNQAEHSSESVLLAAYTAMSDRYARALALANGLADAFHQPDRGPAQLEQLCAVLDDVAAMEAGVRETRDHWDAAGSRPGAELRDTLDQVARQIAQLLELVRSVERVAESQRTALEPQIDAAALSHRMHRAYSSAMESRES